MSKVDYNKYNIDWVHSPYAVVISHHDKRCEWDSLFTGDNLTMQKALDLIDKHEKESHRE